jgi:hypothetical protein
MTGATLDAKWSWFPVKDSVVGWVYKSTLTVKDFGDIEVGSKTKNKRNN